MFHRNLPGVCKDPYPIDAHKGRGNHIVKNSQFLLNQKWSHEPHTIIPDLKLILTIGRGSPPYDFDKTQKSSKVDFYQLTDFAFGL